MADQTKDFFIEREPETITLEEYRRHLHVPAVHFVRPGSERTER